MWWGQMLLSHSNRPPPWQLLSAREGQRSNAHFSNYVHKRLAERYVPPESSSIFPLNCVKAVELWTQADKTMAADSSLTSCSSWHRMHVNTSFSTTDGPRLGPKAIPEYSVPGGLLERHNKQDTH